MSREEETQDRMVYSSTQQLQDCDGVAVAPQGQTGGEGVTTQPATHGVWEGEFFFPKLKNSEAPEG